MTNEDRAAASEVYAAMTSNPDLTDAHGKAIAKRALRISRMGEKRWGVIKAEAERLSAQMLINEITGQEPVPQRPARPHNGPSMGLLLSTELRDASTAHSQAAALFCHCPHCGEALRINASVTKGGE